MKRAIIGEMTPVPAAQGVSIPQEIAYTGAYLQSAVYYPGALSSSETAPLVFPQQMSFFLHRTRLWTATSPVVLPPLVYLPLVT